MTRHSRLPLPLNLRPMLCAIFLLLGSGLAPAQDSPPAPDSAPVLPSVTFSQAFPRVEPAYFSLRIDSAGHAAYESRREEGRPGQPELGEPNRIEFEVSRATARRIFELARSLDYFHGDWDFKKHRIADTGRKTLIYSDSARTYQTTYNWSENSAIQELTDIFQGISNTQEAAYELDRLRRYDRLGLNRQLQHMEEMAKGGWLRELQVIAPVLEKLAGDNEIMHIARQRAQRLLQMAASPPPKISN
ncbi:MAG: hypothetical protein ACRD3A_06790 [Terriglobales bacterium]